MPPTLFGKTVFLACFLLAQKCPLAAQPGVDLLQLDAQIEYFAEHHQQDSLLFYSNKKSQLARHADNLAAWSWTQLDIHDFLSENGNNKEALNILDAALQQRWREPRTPEEWEPFLYMQQNRGWILYQTGRIWQSVEAFENAAQLYARFRYPDFDVVELIYKPLGTHYTRLDDNEKALAVFQKALAVGGDNETLSGLYCNIGLVYWNQGDFTASERYLRQGLELSGIPAARRGLLLGALAQTQLDNGQTQQAYRTATESLRLLRSSSSGDLLATEYRAYSRRTAGTAATEIGRYAEAEQLLADGLADAKKVFGNTSRDVGKIEIVRSHLFRKQGKLLPAVEAANRAMTAVLPSFQPKKPEDNPSAGDFYEENVFFVALEAKAAAAQLLYEKTGSTDWLTLALECHDLAWQAEAKLRRIFQYSSSKLNLQKNARAREEAAMNVVRQLFEKTGQAVYLEKAFAIAERSKATLLLEALQDNLVRQRLAGSDVRFGQITVLRQNLSFYQKNLLLEPASENAPQWRIEADALTGQITKLERALAADYPNLADLSVAVLKNALPTAQDLAEGETLVEYFVSEQFVDVFIFQKNKSAAWHRLPNDANLQALSRRFLSFFENADAILNAPSAYLQTAHALWQKILPPETVTATRLTIVPDGFLNFIPFEALVAATPDGNTSLRNATYLIRRQAVRYAWSLAVLRQQNNLKSTAENYLLAVAPGFANGERGLAPLRAGNAEWQSAGRNLTELVGAAADLQHFLAEAGRYRILHFSTHAFANTAPRVELYDQPMFLPDIYALPLRADLVVLSACQTGLGREQKGEGVMSLARAFAQSGAACIVSSLWSVNDRSTAQLLGRFYDNIGEGQTVGEALRQAKLGYLDDPGVGAAMQSPYFWAGLAAVGTDRPVGKSAPSIGFEWLLLGGAIVMFIFILFRYFVQYRHF